MSNPVRHVAASKVQAAIQGRATRTGVQSMRQQGGGTKLIQQWRLAQVQCKAQAIGIPASTYTLCPYMVITAL